MYSSSLESWTDPNDLDNLVPQQAPQLGTSVLQGHMRKVRHIQGIALRNLNITNFAVNPGLLSNSLATSNGVVGTRKSSISSLMSPTDKYRRRSSVDSVVDNSIDPESPGRLRRPRRNTRDQAPQVIRELQNALQELNTSHLLDSVVVLYAPEQLEPIYISEVVKESMNPEFKEMDLTKLHCRNSHTVNLTVYGKTRSQPSFHQLFSHDTKLGQLRFIGRSLDFIDFSFPTNSFILNLSDGWYVSPEVHVTANSLINSLVSSRDETPITVTSCSFDNIMKLNNLEECIIDAEVTKTIIAKNIQTRLDLKNNLIILTNRKSQIQNRGRKILNQVSIEKSHIEHLLALKTEAQLRLKDTRRSIISGRQKHTEIRELLEQSKNIYDAKLNDISQMETAIVMEQARLANSLISIFPIDLIDNKKYIFSICQLPLLQNINNQNEEEVGAVFGFVSQIVYYLANYLNIPLRYPLQPYGSQSFIIDPISDIQGSRTFPLWTKGSLYYRFEYGLYLLHKDIEQLINSQALPVVDWKQTLGNLKNLLLVISAPSQSKMLASN